MTVSNEASSRKNLFLEEKDTALLPKRSLLEEIKQKKDLTTLSLDASLSADEVRQALLYAQNVLDSLTLTGSWNDAEFRTFTPYMRQVRSLSLVDSTFTNEAFNEAFRSDLSYADPFQDSLAESQEKKSEDWDNKDYTPAARPPLFTDLSRKDPFSVFLNCTKLTELTIENPRALTEGFLDKFLPLRDQLTSLTLKGCPGNITAEEVRLRFPKLQTLVIE